MDIEAYRQRYLAELQSDGAAPPAVSAAELTKAAAEGRDGAQLVEMIEQLTLSGDLFAEGARALLDILANEAIAPPARLAAMRVLAGSRFRPHRFAPFNAEYVDLLRRLATHESSVLRTAALERLALTKDRVAQKLLREGLQKKRKPLVPTAKAIQLLAQDDHAGSRALFRDLAARSTGKAREEALRALSTDPKSAALLESVAADKSEKTQVRQIAAVGLKNASATRFARLARKLVLDESDDDDVRAVAVSAIAQTKDVAGKAPGGKFAKALEATGAATKSRALKASIRQFAKSRGDG
jgi:hypothetical protein